ncbi:hypothetical protein BS47DRAFT_137927 [Hydnum rufescens UP504]|uniref:Uncharacterized protein n=1 Tax=Hydnum rufescens UP504 TaxID=1448309 RepID=A0A9P6APQ4_9AGAM|nr:hypothetical protein BS47DRAFT_137927 [Hydnum rufescens UP504]
MAPQREDEVSRLAHHFAGDEPKCGFVVYLHSPTDRSKRLFHDQCGAPIQSLPCSPRRAPLNEKKHPPRGMRPQGECFSQSTTPMSGAGQSMHPNQEPADQDVGGRHLGKVSLPLAEKPQKRSCKRSTNAPTRTFPTTNDSNVDCAIGNDWTQGWVSQPGHEVSKNLDRLPPELMKNKQRLENHLKAMLGRPHGAITRRYGEPVPWGVQVT